MSLAAHPLATKVARVGPSQSLVAKSAMRPFRVDAREGAGVSSRPQRRACAPLPRRAPLSRRSASRPHAVGHVSGANRRDIFGSPYHARIDFFKRLFAKVCRNRCACPPTTTA